MAIDSRLIMSNYPERGSFSTGHLTRPDVVAAQGLRVRRTSRTFGVAG
jgi:hypothetical protein